MLYTSDIEVCIRVTFKCVCELRAHRAHLISHTHSIIFRYYSACYYALSAYLWQAYASCAHLHPHKRLRNVLSGASVVISREMTSDRAWRWRVSELGDDERQRWEMTEGTRRRWRVWQSRDDECEEVVDTSKLERRWRKGRRGDDECEAVVDTSKRERRWRKRVLWDDVELCGKFYEWDPVGCMGETTQLLQHVISK